MRALLLLVPLLAGVLYLWKRAPLEYSTAGDLGDAPWGAEPYPAFPELVPLAASPAGFFDTMGAELKKLFTPPPAAAPYAGAITAAEQAQGIPPTLLARVLYQESRFRPEIIDGRVRSNAGAVGIAQFMPATARDVGIDPTNPWQSIDGAARYLRRLFDKFGSWEQALAAYNWGQGNQRKDLRDGIVGNQWPTETRRYVSEILADVDV